MPMFISGYIDSKLKLFLTQDEINQRNTQLDLFFNKILHFPPANLDTKESIHYSDTYREKIEGNEEKMKLMSCIVEKIFYPITLTRKTIPSCLDFWGAENLPTDYSQSQRLYVVQKAAVFSYTDIGNCANRASYAGIELFEIFKNTNVQIQVVSYSEIDHFVLKIGNASDGWKIYDPLTNPQLLFEEDEYNREIKSLFKHVPSPKQPINFTIDLKSIALFNFQLRKITNFVLRERQKTTIEALKKDLNYHQSLMISGIEDPFYEKTIAAYIELCELLGWDVDPTLEMNHGLS
jgi:hypothetical protein